MQHAGHIRYEMKIQDRAVYILYSEQFIDALTVKNLDNNAIKAFIVR